MAAVLAGRQGAAELFATLPEGAILPAGEDRPMDFDGVSDAQIELGRRRTLAASSEKAAAGLYFGPWRGFSNLG